MSTQTASTLTSDDQFRIPASFESRKRKILAELSVPDAKYTDLSPKGSVDEGIRDLIRDVNGLPGLVTTSSCAGRVSVFLEGRKKQKSHSGVPSSTKKDEDDADQPERQFTSTGGKGGGRWLYVSHDPVTLLSKNEDTGEGKSQSFHELFGMVPGDGNLRSGSQQGLRLVRFHFEPMILHIMTATLQHAQPILTAASSAGFRESGLQSLRCLSDAMGTSPIVAVRSSGLSLESIIGYCNDEEAQDQDQDQDSPTIHSLVTEEYLRMLVAIANERFSVNAERVERFRTKLLDLCSATSEADAGSNPKGKGGKSKPAGWEDESARRERKRAEGLARKKAMLDAQGSHGASEGAAHATPSDDEIGPIFAA